MKKLIRIIINKLFKYYPLERGKYSILKNIFLKYLSPKSEVIETVKVRGGFNMLLNLNEYIQSHLYIFNSYELPTVKFFEKHINKNDVILDVGANVGYMSLTFSNLVGNDGKIYSFEPEPKNFNILQKNIQINNISNVFSYNMAISDKEKILNLYLSNDSNSGTHSTIFNKTSVSQNHMEVTAIPLDKFIVDNSLDRIDLIKVDVEGAEVDVLNGMDNLLKKFKPTLVIELVSGLQTNRNLSTVEFKKILFDKYGYVPYMIDNKGNLVKVNIEYEHISDNVVFKMKK